MAYKEHLPIYKSGFGWCSANSGFKLVAIDCHGCHFLAVFDYGEIRGDSVVNSC